MPSLSSFYGITIWMYRPDHHPPHFHAQYGEHWAQIGIAEQEVLAGSLRHVPIEPLPSMSTMTVEPLDGHNLRLTFNDGVVRDVDLSQLLHGPLGEPLRDPDYFRQVRVDQQSRTIVWPNGLDPDPDMLHDSYPPTRRTGTRTATV
jgi:hypothetical protein